MGWQDLLLRLRALAYRRQVESELDEELKFHLEMEVRKNEAAGLTAAEAGRHARIRFNGLERVRDECRDVRGLAPLENLVRDIRYGIRMLRKTPAFTAIAILSLALGIGANTAIFSLIDTVLLRTLPVKNPEQLILLRWSANDWPRQLSYLASSGRHESGRALQNVFSWPVFEALRSRSRTLADAFGFSHLGTINVVAHGQPLTGGGPVVSGNYFSGLGVTMAAGRPIAADDDTAAGVAAVVISYRFWERAFGRDPAAIGAPILVNAEPCTVVGVAPRGFFGVSAGGFVGTPEVDVSLPISARARLDRSPRRSAEWFGADQFWIQMMGRMRPAVDERQVRAELTPLLNANMPRDAVRDSRTGPVRVETSPGSQGLDYLRRLYHRPLAVLMGLVGLTLLMVCANLAGLLTARAAFRRKEIGLRLALGAGRRRLVGQLLVEGALLTSAGAVAGLLVARWGTHVLMAMSSGRNAILLDVRPDVRILAFTAAVSLAATLLFALAPALRATRADLALALKQDASARAAGRFGQGGILVAAQVAVAVLLISGAALFTRSLANLRAVPLGFEPKNLLLFGLAPGRSGYGDAAGMALYQRVLDRLNRTPGIAGATLSGNTPISDFYDSQRMAPEGGGPQAGVPVNVNFVGPEFLGVLGIPMAAGRGLGPARYDGQAARGGDQRSLCPARVRRGKRAGKAVPLAGRAGRDRSSGRGERC